MSSFILKTDNTDEVLVRKNEAVLKSLKAIGIQAQKYATLDCPVDTGRLQGSIVAENDGNTVQVGTNVEYAPYVEMGTYKMDARPFIKPSIENHIPEYEALFKRILENA